MIQIKMYRKKHLNEFLDEISTDTDELIEGFAEAFNIEEGGRECIAPNEEKTNWLLPRRQKARPNPYKCQ